jgi:flavodoxin
MQVLVMYYSRTGNTKKLAEAIAESRTSKNLTKTLDIHTSHGYI